uniref:Uncharacterized protein n=1 Tax=viral metagenome TaxID=1070528 RepID=A0A6C0JMS6_9ZZZZ
MCYSSNMSFSFATVGIIAAIYIKYYDNFNYKYLELLLLFYSIMEILQGIQYYYVNQCSNIYNILMTEFAYILVIVQPFMWNFFYYKNSTGCDKQIFITGMALSVCWAFTHILTRLLYTKENGMKYKDSVYGSDTVCTKKNKSHLYWQWTSANFFDLNPSILMYLLIWFVPALISIKHRYTSIILILSFLLSLIVSIYNNEMFLVTSLWCYISVPIVLAIIYNIIIKNK